MMRIIKIGLWSICIMVVICIALLLICNQIVVNNAKGKVYSELDSIAPTEWGLLLGTTPQTRIGHRKNLFFKYRIDAAEQLYKAGKIKRILISGDENSLDGMNEVICMKDSLVARGVDAKDIVLDGKGFRTLDSMVRTNKVFSIKSFIIISQLFHNERALYLAEHLDLDVEDLQAYNAISPNAGLSFITYLREYLARVKMFLDILTDKQPKEIEKQEDLLNYSYKPKSVEKSVFSCPPIIYLKPYSDFSKQEAQALVPHLKRFLKENSLSEMDVVVLPNIKLADSLMNDKRSRYRGDKMINSIPEDGHNAIILLTHKDISVTYKGRPDWGVLGLSLMPKHVCVASDFRLKNKKRDLWKVACHELLHSFFNMQHCPKDDPLCIIKDAKGKANFGPKEHLCKTCAETLKKNVSLHHQD